MSQIGPSRSRVSCDDMMTSHHGPQTSRPIWHQNETSLQSRMPGGQTIYIFLMQAKQEKLKKS